MNNERPPASSPSDRPVLHGVDWAVQAGATDEVMLGTQRRVRRRRQERLALVATVGLCVLGVSLWVSPLSRPSATTVVASRSAVIEAPARQVLPDGSVVELKDGAVIAVAYTPGTRRIVLQRGEAHFQVVKDPARPFIVAVDAVEVRAVGTSFSVQRRTAQVEVLVTTGRVAVDRVVETQADSPPTDPQTIATLDAGNRTLVEATPSAAAPVVEPLTTTEMGQRLAWRVPRLEFTRTALSEAIPMINQHSTIKLSLADPSLGSVRISGLLRVDNVETLFHLLEVEHGIKADRLDSGEVILRRAR
ncbi:MAG: FecR domain-containing protein [Verrucomicrobiota bacterium]